MYEEENERVAFSIVSVVRLSCSITPSCQQEFPSNKMDVATSINAEQAAIVAAHKPCLSNNLVCSVQVLICYIICQ